MADDSAPRVPPAAALVCLLVFVLAWASPRWIAFNMDEFVHYHALGCAAFPLSERFNVYREGCHQYDLRLPYTQTFLPLRSYFYIGSLPSAPFYPFWKLIDDPSAVRIQGALFFFLATLLASRLLGVAFGTALLGGLVFPLYLFAFIVDLGPVGISLVLLLAGLVLAQAAARAAGGGRMAALAILAGLTFFLGFFVKLLFAWCAPALAIFVLFRARPAATPLGTFLRRSRFALLAGGIALAAPTLLLALAEDVRGLPYYRAVRVGRFSTQPQAIRDVAVRMLRYLWDGSDVIPRTLVWPTWLVDVVPALVALALLAWGLASREARRETAAWASMAAGVFAFMVTSRGAYWPHHFVFALVFLLLGITAVLGRLAARRSVVRGVALLAAFHWASLFVRLPQARESPEADRNKDRMLAFIRSEGVDRRAVQVHTSWGTYYIAHLFGDPSETVLFIKGLPDRPDLLAEVKALADADSRGLLLLSSRRRERIETDAVREALGPPIKIWRFGDWWAVEFLR